MLTTSAQFLENDLYDVVRMFKNKPESIVHAMNYKEGSFFNEFNIDGKTYFFKDEKLFEGEIEYKRFAKRYAKFALYKLLSELYNEKMPWGALTGIRPVKYSYGEEKQGRNYVESLRNVMVSEENIELVRSVIQNQEGIYELNGDNSDFFVSIPFCPTKCEYCSFITAPIDKTERFLEGYVTALEKEIAGCKELIKNLRSVYVGGGTPLVLNEKYLKRTLEAIAKVRDNGCEYTVEAGRPDVFTEEKLKMLKDYGVTRICINSQSFLDGTLEKIGRRHTAKDVYDAFEMSAKYGFDINCDLIAGLADESVEDFTYSVNEAVKCGPDNITVHTLCLKKGAKLKEECEYLNTQGISDMILASREILRENGYSPYYLYRQKYMAGNCENTGWTKKGKACIYNIDIMEEIASNPAAGANAVSKRVFDRAGKIERYGSPKDLKTYIEKIDEIIAVKRALFSKQDI